MRIVVVGMAKSGTTALAYAVKSAMPADTQLLFEPRTHVTLEASDVVAKVLLHPNQTIGDGFYQQFDRMILLTRDTRDLLISGMLYRVFGDKVLCTDSAKLDRYLDVLRAKETDPRSVSLTQINQLYRELLGIVAPQRDEASRWRWLLAHAAQFHDSHPQCLAFSYESLVAGKFASLASYLSVTESRLSTKVPDELSRVTRSKRAGNWQDWFCPEDVEHYRPVFKGYMDRYGYVDDWTLNPHPAIRTEECSGYVLRLMRERREKGVPVAD